MSDKKAKLTPEQIKKLKADKDVKIEQNQIVRK
jgi:hypothetical protein